MGHIFCDREVFLVLEDNIQGDGGSGRSPLPLGEELLPYNVVDDLLAVSEHGGRVGEVNEVGG